ncbi:MULTISPECIES: hypothetical protein [Bacillus]|uniref:Uncharacterized protein n=2 Tax=Bacillus subtilis group TaxID=653685 RepID=A0A9Q4HS42_9BACI|nr:MULTISPECIES: hypothetical protein [Bacillus]MBU5263491.1 hypothetical protein [Bacillus atrophaeus]MCY8083683.1 hypothetical protein [Bacillus inaquosorum]MCY8138512.1 hypothetical protein [Bacillus inaquosorum]MCY8165102.1 hypothetical protein [Bacillus inaquosorum]MCY8169653.1 hypothetical protein [Bacillus inaquosorum]
MDYIYKEKKNGNRIISIRDKWENALIEFEQKGNQIDIVINYRNEKTTKFSLPIETFEKVYQDIKNK